MKFLHTYNSTIHGPYKRMSIRYGLLLGAIMCLTLIVRYLINSPANSPLSLVDNIIMLIVMSFSLYIYRRTLDNGLISFKESYLFSLFSGIIGSIIYGFFTYCYITYIDTQMPMRCQEVLKQVEDYKEYTAEQFTQMTKPSFIALQAIIYNIIMSVLWSFVVSILLKTEKSKIKQ